MSLYIAWGSFRNVYQVLIDIRTPGSQFDYMVIEHQQSFDTYFCSLGLSVAKIHEVI